MSTDVRANNRRGRALQGIARILWLAAVLITLAACSGSSDGSATIGSSTAQGSAGTVTSASSSTSTSPSTSVVPDVAGSMPASTAGTEFIGTWISENGYGTLEISDPNAGWMVTVTPGACQ